MTYDVIIAGGGLAGLTSAISLSKQHKKVLLIEKNNYPHHKVCGEYVSNEVLPILNKLGVHVGELSPASIKNFILSSNNGNYLEMPLDLGGFGISRYRFDEFLYHKAKEAGAEAKTSEKIYELKFNKEGFVVKTDKGEYTSKSVIGSFGKRSNLDNQLDREFLLKKSPYMGIKYHAQLDFPVNTIAIHHFDGGYFGINKIEGDLYCLCYLILREKIKEAGGIPEAEEKFLWQNKHIKELLQNSKFINEKPETINEISFETKPVIEDHIFMAGDAAGMIVPLFGNGMAVAISSGEMATHQLNLFLEGRINREQAEQNYSNLWKKKFSARFKTGKLMQKYFESKTTVNAAVAVAKAFPVTAKWIMKMSHG